MLGSFVKSKRSNVCQEASMQTMKFFSLLELPGIDFLCLESCKGGYQYLLVITKHFTRIAQAYATTNKSSKIAADLFYDDFIMRYSLPRKIISDTCEGF